MPTKQEPPKKGWRFDPETRGWYSPRYRTFLEAKAKGGKGTAWLSRRQYDEQFGRLQGTTYEQSGKERKQLRIAPQWHRIVNNSHGTHSRTNWYSHRVNSVNDINTAIANLRPGQRMMIVGYGQPGIVSPRKTNERGYVYRSLMQGGQGVIDVQSFRAGNLDLNRLSSIDHFEIKVEFP